MKQLAQRIQERLDMLRTSHALTATAMRHHVRVPVGGPGALFVQRVEAHDESIWIVQVVLETLEGSDEVIEIIRSPFLGEALTSAIMNLGLHLVRNQVEGRYLQNGQLSFPALRTAVLKALDTAAQDYPYLLLHREALVRLYANGAQTEAVVYWVEPDVREFAIHVRFDPVRQEWKARLFSDADFLSSLSAGYVPDLTTAMGFALHEAYHQAVSHGRKKTS